MSQTVQRATEIMELVARSPRSSEEIARHFDLHRSTAFRQLQTLEQAGFLARRDDGTYGIGARIIAIAQEALDNLDLRHVAYEDIRGLHERAGASVQLAQVLEGRIVYVDGVENRDGVRMYSRVGRSAVPNATAVGKAILAHLKGDERDRMLARADWVAYTPTTITNRAELDAELARIREQGWAADNGEFEEFVVGVAAPIANSAGTVVGAVAVSAVTMVAGLDHLRGHVGDLLATAGIISRQLG